MKDASLAFFITRLGAYLYDDDIDQKTMKWIVPESTIQEDEDFDQFCEHLVNTELTEEDIVYANNINDNNSLVYSLCQYNNTSNKDVLIKPKEANIDENSNIEFIIVGAQHNNTANLEDIISAVSNRSEETNIHLYVDVQGGDRTSQLVINNIIQILCDESSYSEEAEKKYELTDVCATKYDFGKPWEHEILSEIDRYRTINAVSGMNAFIRYGKTNSIVTYFKNPNGQYKDKISKLKEQLNQFKNSLNDNNPDALFSCITKINEIVNPSIQDSTDQNNDNRDYTIQDEMYIILADKINQSLNALRDKNGQLDSIKFVDWLMQKEYLLQAVTFAESMLPEYFFNKGLFYIENEAYIKPFYIMAYYKERGTRISYKNKLVPSMSKKEIKYQYRDPYHYFITQYLRTVTESGHAGFITFEDCRKELLDSFNKMNSFRNILVHVDNKSDKKEAPLREQWSNNWKKLKNTINGFSVPDEPRHQDLKAIIGGDPCSNLSEKWNSIIMCSQKNHSYQITDTNTFIATFLSVIKYDIKQEKPYFIKKETCDKNIN